MAASPDTSVILTPTSAANDRPQRPGWRRFAWKALLAGVLVVSPFGIFAGYIVLGHNFHVVSPGQIYRSAQLDPADLARIVQQHGIKSVLNLRGANTKHDWYNAETNTAQQLGVRHFDFELSASQELTDAEMQQILAIISNAPKPMLIHCKSGADRTGLVSALYLYSLEGKSAREADRELSVFTAHVPYLFWEDTSAMDRSFWRYVGSHSQPAAKLDSSLTKRESPLAPAGTSN